jgi:hypothetical protein
MATSLSRIVVRMNNNPSAVSLALGGGITQADVLKLARLIEVLSLRPDLANPAILLATNNGVPVDFNPT